MSAKRVKTQDLERANRHIFKAMCLIGGLDENGLPIADTKEVKALSLVRNRIVTHLLDHTLPEIRDTTHVWSCSKGS